jgi:Holliday junction resolvasome RuvABC endonuclease subunit
MKAVLGIDPGTSTGWAVCRGAYDTDKLWYADRIIASGVAALHGVADKGYGAMFVAFRALLQNLQRNHGPFAAIAYELPFLRGPVASRILWGMAAHVQERCAMWRCCPLPVNTMTLKKFATGSGKAGKPEMIDAAWKTKCASGHPLEVPGEHEADAIHVARWGWAQLQKRQVEDG